MPEEKNCRICGLELSDSGHNGDRFQYDCPNCGQYVLTGTAKAMLVSRVSESPRFAAVLSHALRRMQRKDRWPEISSDTLKKIEENQYLPGPAEQADNLVLLLGEELESPGSYYDLVFRASRARIGAMNVDGVGFIVKSLLERGVLEGNPFLDGKANLTLSFEGWAALDRLKRKTSVGDRIFMAMSFANLDLPQIFIDYFKPAVAKAGFQLIRLDEQPQAGSIDERLRVEIRRSRLLVADLTDANPGAYWEAGFAEGLGKPVIYTCERDVFDRQGTHFDTNHFHTVLWSRDEPSIAAEELKATIRATLPDEAKMSDES